MSIKYYILILFITFSIGYSIYYHLTKNGSQKYTTNYITIMRGQ